MKILIEEKSIRKNPNAGKTEVDAYGLVNITINVGGKSIPVRCKPSSEILQKLSKKYGPISIEMNRSHERMRSLAPDPDFLFNYKSTKVTCTNCNKQFYHTKLQSDYIYTEEGEIYSNKICPHCETWDCIEDNLDFETLEEYKRRTRCILNQ